jgi:hypothetical protein
MSTVPPVTVQDLGMRELRQSLLEDFQNFPDVFDVIDCRNHDTHYLRSLCSLPPWCRRRKWSHARWLRDGLTLDQRSGGETLDDERRYPPAQPSRSRRPGVRHGFRSATAFGYRFNSFGFRDSLERVANCGPLRLEATAPESRERSNLQRENACTQLGTCRADNGRALTRRGSLPAIISRLLKGISRMWRNCRRELLFLATNRFQLRDCCRQETCRYEQLFGR